MSHSDRSHTTFANVEGRAEMLRDDAASLDEIKTLLTFCVRGERFCEGLWGDLIREGRNAAMLKRLEELRSRDA